VVPEIEEGFELIVRPDLPGFGESSLETGFDWSLENRGKFVEVALREVGVPDDVKVVVVVHDHGGPFGLVFVVACPRRVRGLVMQNTVFNQLRWHLFAMR